MLTGDALVTEDNRLQERINHINDRIEASLRQSLRTAVTDGGLPPEANISAHASLLTHLVLGRWLRYAQSGWRVAPTLHLDEQLRSGAGLSVRETPCRLTLAACRACAQPLAGLAIFQGRRA